MSGRPIVVASLQIDAEKEAAFSAFYHHRHLPALMRQVPEIVSARRYQEHHVEGSLKYYRKQFLTILECATPAAAELVRAAVDQASAAAPDEAAALRDGPPACVYVERWAHPRAPADGAFGSRPFFMVSVEVEARRAQAFNDWYEQVYLPRNVADVPLWAACRRYGSVGRTPARHLTIYESHDLSGLDHSLEMMRAPYRLEENMSWKQWDTGSEPAITWEDAATFRPIFRNP
ncbi:MAG: hypothetical protein K2Y40_01505 [Reyranella sp.]|nr:hypothetical protein [Reyranella sp.]